MKAHGQWIPAQLGRDFESRATTVFRLAKGPAFWIERFGGTALLSTRPESDPSQILIDLKEWSQESGWEPDRIFHRRLTLEPAEKDIPHLLRGDPSRSPREIVSENGLLYEVDFSSGYNPGLFPDQRANRSFLCSRNPRRVLNTFAHTCAFSVAAASVRAETLSVDISKSSLQRGRRNFELNQLPTDGHRFIAEDVPTFLRRLAKRGEKFDRILLDPPTFGRGGTGKTFRFERDFPALLESALALAAPDAEILLSTNSTTWDAQRLIIAAQAVLPRTVDFVTVPPPPDFTTQSPSATVWVVQRRD